MNAVLLVGIPGSGKSTFARERLPNHVRVSQDELGSVNACINAVKDALGSGKNVVIDRCNQTPKQRKRWIDIARLYGASVSCVYLDCSEQTALKRVRDRKTHETLVNLTIDKLRRIVRGFKHEMVVPCFNEGFDSILLISERANEKSSSC